MFRHLLSSGLAALLMLAGTAASAQVARPSVSAGLVRAASISGIVHGIVVDAAGVMIPGATVMALGRSFAADISDAQGRFSLALPAGDYVLGAALDGYAPASRHLLRVRANSSVERRITIQREAPAAAAVVQPSVASSPTPPESERGGDSHSEIAWRLRQLPRTVLRGVSPAPAASTAEPEAPSIATSFVDLLLAQSIRQTTTFFTETEFTGQVNLLTTASMSMEGATPAAWSRGIADLAVGAPVGTSGDWSVRAALGVDDMASWTLVGEYRARSDQRHAVRLGVAYGTQGYVTGHAVPARNLTFTTRSAGGVRASDRWRIHDGRFEVDYGGRFDRYDYLSRPDLLGGHVGARARVARDTLVIARASREMIAPGADQFLPPSAAGPWLPPARTFSPLSRRGALTPEDVRTVAAGLEQRFGSTRRGVARVEWFSQSVSDQIATLFGLDEASEVGHYYLATPGSVSMTGWRARLAGDLHRHVRGSVELVSGRAAWTPAPGMGALRRDAPALVRRGTDVVRDLQTSLVVKVPRTSTNVAVDYRLSLAAARDSAPAAPRLTSGRVNVELRQQLPYQPLHSGEWNVLFTLRTLVHDRDGGSIYDELLTSRPPARMTGGLQVRF